MVVSSTLQALRKFSTAVPGKPGDYESRLNLRTYGYPLQHIKHHFCLAPLHFCTGLGSIVAGIYIIRMLYIRDCVLFSWRKTAPQKQTEKITLFQGNVDYSKRPQDVYPVKLD